MAKGQFDMNDLRSQLAQMKRMGGIGAMISDAARHGQARRAGRESRRRRQAARPHGGHHPVDDAEERGKPEVLNAKRKIASQTAPERRAGGQPPHQDAPGNGHRDEEDQKDGRPQGARRHDGKWAADSVSAAE